MVIKALTNKLKFSIFKLGGLLNFMKNQYREFFNQVKFFIKFQPFLDILNINKSAFSRFMKNDNFNYEISDSKLNELQLLIVEQCKDVSNLIENTGL